MPATQASFTVSQSTFIWGPLALPRCLGFFGLGGFGSLGGFGFLGVTMQPCYPVTL